MLIRRTMYWYGFRKGNIQAGIRPQEQAGTDSHTSADNSGVLNRYTAVFDSSISYIDTATHYSYFINSVPVTNYDGIS